MSPKRRRSRPSSWVGANLSLPSRRSVYSTSRMASGLKGRLTTAILTDCDRLMLARARFGRRAYAVGGDAEVALRAGVSPGSVRIRMMVLCSTMAGLAGVALAFRQGIGDPRAGDGLELLSIVAVVIRGVSIFGGRGHIFGVAGGVVFLTILRNAMNLQGVDALLVGVISGVLIIVAVVVFTRTER